MPKSSPQKRAIDQKVGAAERDLRSAFAFVAKKRANIWVTAAGVLFVMGIALAFLTIGDSAMQGNAAFLRSKTSGSTTSGSKVAPALPPTPNRTGTSGTVNIPAQLHPSYGDSGTAVDPSNVSNSTSTSTSTSNSRVANTTTGTTPTVGINNAAGNPYADFSRDCSWKRPDQCAVTIDATATSVQGQQKDFKIYATPQKKQCGPGDPGYVAGNPNSCQYILALWPSVNIDWGDGSRQSSNIRTSYKHAYLAAGTYTVTVTARYNQQQFLSLDGKATPIESYTIAPITKTITVTAASSAVLRATLNSGSRPAGAVAQNARAVEFAKIDITNPTGTAKTLNAMLIGCRDGYAPRRNNGTAAPQPFAANKYFTVQSTSGGGQAVTFSSAREFFGAFSGAQFQLDSQLLFNCMSGAFRAGGTRSGSSAITVPANGTTTVTLIADVGSVDPCTRLQLGIIAGYEGGGSGPLIANSAMGNLQIVPGTNPLTGETCSAATVGGTGTAGTGGSASAATSKTPASTGTSGTKGTQTPTDTK